MWGSKKTRRIDELEAALIEIELLLKGDIMPSEWRLAQVRNVVSRTLYK